MNCVSNNNKKDIIYKGRRIGGGENYMLDKDGNYIDSITDNTKEINELNKQLKELLSKGDEKNDELTKQFAEIQDKINQSVDEKLKALEKVMTGSMEKAAAQSAMNIITAVYSATKNVAVKIKLTTLSGKNNEYTCRLEQEPKEVIMAAYKPSTGCVGWVPIKMTVKGSGRYDEKSTDLFPYVSNNKLTGTGKGWLHKGDSVKVQSSSALAKGSSATYTVTFSILEYFSSKAEINLVE